MVFADVSIKSLNSLVSLNWFIMHKTNKQSKISKLSLRAYSNLFSLCGVVVHWSGNRKFFPFYSLIRIVVKLNDWPPKFFFLFIWKLKRRQRQFIGDTWRIEILLHSNYWIKKKTYSFFLYSNTSMASWWRYFRSLIKGKIFRLFWTSHYAMLGGDYLHP